MGRFAMKCINRLAVVMFLGLGFMSGCGKGDSAGNSTAGVPVIKETDPNSNPMARAAYDFLDAVLKGDTQQAGSMLTPTAMQRIIASGKGFAPPGLDTATFKIGQVRAPSGDQAIVQCVLTDTVEGKPHSEEMCCLLKKVENQWRISGIAYGTGPNMPWTLTDFESGNSMAIPRQTMGGMANNQPNGAQPPNAGVQAGAAPQPPLNPPAPLGPPAIGPANVNSPNAGTAGLGMPSVGPAGSGQLQPPTQPQYPQYQAPYTAQEPQGQPPR
jgi:hypothetical protein